VMIPLRADDVRLLHLGT